MGMGSRRADDNPATTDVSFNIMIDVIAMTSGFQQICDIGIIVFTCYS